MKQKIFKIITVIILLTTLTITNFITVGVGLVSYAASENSTNNQNVEFSASVKENNILALEIGVKKEGYFNGEITLTNSNFKLKQTENNYVNKIEENTIKLNQINAQTTAKIEIEIEPIKEEIFDIGLLSAPGELNLTGTYKDSSEKDIKIKATRKVNLQYKEENTIENVENKAEIITNKVLSLNGEEKRVVQVAINLGLKENSYPIKSIKAQVTAPTVENTIPDVEKRVEFNNMTHYNYKRTGKNIEFSFTNEPNDKKLILWRNEGTENIILTFVYEKDMDVTNLEIPVEATITLHNGKELKQTNKIAVGKEEKNGTVEISTKTAETNIYKGKLNSGLEKEYETTTKLEINLKQVSESIKINEEPTTYSSENGEIPANVVYSKTTIKKEDFDKIFGQTGKLTILNENKEQIATVDNSTQIDENKNIVVDYQGKEPQSIEIVTTAPVAEGTLEFTHTKIIKPQEKETIAVAKQLANKITYSYNQETKQVETKIKLEESKTEVQLEANKSTLATSVENEIELRAILKSNKEEYNLYTNPSLVIQLPDEVEAININSIDIVYEEELKIANYRVEGKNIIVELQGTQTNYKEAGIQGAIIVINANVKVQKTASTNETKIMLACQNGQEVVQAEKQIKVVAPKDITAIHNIKELQVETTGQEKTRNIKLQKENVAKQLETQIAIINNNDEAIENVRIMGTFPTKNAQNNIDIKVLEAINMQVEAKVYYTENENATEDLQNSSNAWEESIKDASKVRKYLVVLPKIDAKETVVGTYKVEMPEVLDYNMQAKQEYTVKYINNVSKVESQVTATTITMTTGVGAKLEAKLQATLGGKQLGENSTIKKGEIIKYEIQVVNAGSEELRNIAVVADIPEGTKLVAKEANYEYTGTSYYKELDEKTLQGTIETLAEGKTHVLEYEVRVDKDAKVGELITNKAKVIYADTQQETNEIKLKVEDANIRITLKRITDRNVKLYQDGEVQYFAIVENISNKKLENVKVNTNLPEGLEVVRLGLITGMEAEDVTDEMLNKDTAQEEGQIEPKIVQEPHIKVEDIEYKQEVNIGTLEVGETKVLSYDTIIKSQAEGKTLEMAVSAKEADKEYTSNRIVENISKIEVSLAMTANVNSKYVKAGDIIEYTIKVKNESESRIEGIVVNDTIPASLTVNKVTFDDQEIESLKGENEIEISCNLAEKSESTIKIETIVNHSAGRKEPEVITNMAKASRTGTELAKTTELSHIIEAEESNGDSGNNNQSNKVENNDIANGSRSIAGMAWFDENANGKKDENETLLQGVKVHLLNTQTNNLVTNKEGQTLEAVTNDNGQYVLSNIGNGSYIAIFEYNNTQYALTKYKVTDANEGTNSNAMMNNLTVNGENKKVASTDIISIDNTNIADINIGLIKLENFDMQLEKFVSKIILQDGSGTTVREYNNETLAKLEIDRKKVSGTTVIIEYKIVVSNIGEVAGYARKVADYLPNDLKFSSELNPDWYQSGETLYNTSLGNEKIEADQSRELTLTVTKALTENNTGRTNNTAEIAESYNELGLEDSNSTAGNKVNGENDLGSADILLSIRTGGGIMITAIIVGVLMLGLFANILIQIKKETDEE